MEHPPGMRASLPPPFAQVRPWLISFNPPFSTFVETSMLSDAYLTYEG
jgi:hypothetical protein